MSALWTSPRRFIMISSHLGLAALRLRTLRLRTLGRTPFLECFIGLGLPRLKSFRTLGLA